MADREGHRVVVVDDYPDTVEVLSMMLGFFGHETRGATTGAEALQVIDDFKPDVALIDLDLPDIDGHDLSRRIRARSTHPPWIIVITGWVLDERSRRQMEGDVDDFLLKPIGLHTLDGVLQTGLSMRAGGVVRPSARPARSRDSNSRAGRGWSWLLLAARSSTQT